MSTLALVIALTLLPLAIDSWVLGRSARALGSPRGRFVFGLAAMIAIALLSLIFTGLAALLDAPAGSPFGPAPATDLHAAARAAAMHRAGAGLLSLIAAFVVLRAFFALSWKRGAILACVYLGLTVVWIIVALG